MLTDGQIFERVRGVLVDALSVDEDEVTPNAALMADLDATSIDFLDIDFRLEHEFSIKIRGKNFSPDDMFEDGDLQSGKLTEQGIQRISEGKLVWVDSDRARVGMEREKLFTVRSLCRWVQSTLQNQESEAKKESAAPAIS